MDFKNQRYVTSGVTDRVAPLLQAIIWGIIDDMPKPKDYLQVFKLTVEDKKQKIIHIQEEPEYQREYLLSADCFEIVTHPMTLEYHANEMPWLKLMERAIDLGYRSHS